MKNQPMFQVVSRTLMVSIRRLSFRTFHIQLFACCCNHLSSQLQLWEDHHCCFLSKLLHHTRSLLVLCFLWLRAMFRCCSVLRSFFFPLLVSCYQSMCWLVVVSTQFSVSLPIRYLRRWWRFGLRVVCGLRIVWLRVGRWRLSRRLRVERIGVVRWHLRLHVLACLGLVWS